jgi:aspartate/methionine/tyrosine aminotransferase
MPKATVDRFEEDRAVLIIDGRQVTRPRAELPAEAREGDVIDLKMGKVDREATEALREQVRQARRRVKKKKAPPGNFDL